MVCSPRDALTMFYASGLEHLILEDVYVCKGGPAAGVAGGGL